MPFNAHIVGPNIIDDGKPYPWLPALKEWLWNEFQLEWNGEELGPYDDDLHDCVGYVICFAVDGDDHNPERTVEQLSAGTARFLPPGWTLNWTHWND
jgi:hypothetical protein